MKNKICLLIGTIIILVGCEYSTEEAKPFDSAEYLEKCNSDRQIYLGTKSYKFYLENKTVSYEIKDRMDLMMDDEINHRDLDSVRSWLQGDTLFISHVIFVSGGCAKYLPYFDTTQQSVILNCPEIVSGFVSIEENDTSFVVHACPLTNVFELLFKLPMKDLPLRDKMYYHEQEISVYRELVQSKNFYSQ